MSISIHASTRGATFSPWLCLSKSVFQSTLPREERLLRRMSFPFPEHISIHASTRGATHSPVLALCLLLFQSTLPREERRGKNTLSPTASDFNPRFHERSDIDMWHNDKIKAVISIHASTRGATMTHYDVLQAIYFNPRFHERSDCIFFCASKERVISIHASTRGATISLLHRSYSPYAYFNPRFHERSDSNGLMMFDDTLISIHASTRGATMVGCCLHFNHIYFNPRFHERSDVQSQQYLNLFFPISIHASTRGATISTSSPYQFLVFQSTLPREERRFILCRIYQWKIFQSTLPREERQGPS